MELLLIRHALPEMVITEGEPADPSLTDEGCRQAGMMAGWLRDQPIERLYTSPMKRAVETALPLAETHALTGQVHEGVAEFDRDSDRYIPVEQLKGLDYERWQRLMRGETNSDFQGFAATVIHALSEIASANRGRTVAVVCHGGVINVWAAHVMGFDPRMFFNPNYTSINRFRVAGSGQKSVITLNEQAHLQPGLLVTGRVQDV